MSKDKKVNIEAFNNAVREQSPGLYADVTSEQYHNIVIFTPGAYQYAVEDLVALSMRLTHNWSNISVASPRPGTHEKPAMIVGVNSLLPEFIVEGEEWLPEDDENDDS